MTALIEALLVFLFFSVIPLSATERIEELRWNKNPEADVVRYEVFRGIEKIGETSGTSLKVVLPLDGCTVAIRAVNAAGIQSAMSSPLTVPSIWSRVLVVVQFSHDLTTWGASFTPATRFARAKIITP